MNAPFVNPQQSHITETPAAPKVPLDVDETIEQWVAYHKSLGAQIKELEDRRKDARNTILKAVEQRAGEGNGAELKHNGRLIATVTPQTTKRLNTSALKEKEPEIYDKFAYEDTSLVLRVK